MIEGILFDVDGVLLDEGCVLPGAVAALEEVASAGLEWCCLTNVTRRSRRQVSDLLVAQGLPVPAERVLTPAVLAGRRLRADPGVTVRLFAHSNLEKDLAGARLVRDGGADRVLLGDLGRGFDYDVMQEIFSILQSPERELWALHRNPVWKKDGKLRLDMGPFVAALEVAIGRPATVLGKPSADAFLEACSALSLPPDRVMMVGDDVVVDVDGARKAGLEGVLVRSAKYRPDLVERYGLPDDHVLDGVADLPRWLESRS